MADNFIGLNIGGNAPEQMNKIGNATEQTAASFKSAKAELRALQAQMGNMDVNSKEFAVAAERAGKLKDQLNDAADAVKGSTGPAFESMNNTFGVMQGQLANLDFDGLGQSLSSMGRAVSRISFKTIKDEIGGLIRGLGQLAMAVVTNPFLLIGATLAAIAMNWKEVSAWMNQTSLANQAVAEATKALNDEYNAQLQSQAKQITQVQTLTKVVTDHSLSERERQHALEDLQVLYPEYFKNQGLDIDNTQALTKAKDALIEKIKQEAKSKAAQSLLEKEYANQIALEAQARENLNKLGMAAYFEAVSTARTNNQTLFKETNQAISDWVNSSSAGVGQIQLQLESTNAKIAYLEGIAVTSIIETADKEVKEIKSKQKQKVQVKRETLGEIYDLEKSYNLKIVDDATIAQDKLNQSFLNGHKTRLLVSKEYNDELLKADQSLYEAKFALANAGADLLGTVFQKNKKIADVAFALQKALAIGQIVVDTQKEIAGYYANPTWSTLPDGGLTLKTTAALGAKLRAATGIATIVASSIGKFMNGGSSASVSGGGGGGSAPSLSGGGGSTQPTTLSLGFLNNQPQQQQPFQAYVIGSQVNTAIEAQALIRNQARLH